MHLEAVGHDLRLLRATKNRFGPAREIGLVEMTGTGLVDVTDAGSRFLIERHGPSPSGIAAATVFEGSRVLLVELQSLVAEAKASLPRVYADGADLAWVTRLAVVLERNAGAVFGAHDMYVNVPGGIRLRDVTGNLPLALYSATHAAAAAHESSGIRRGESRRRDSPTGDGRPAHARIKPARFWPDRRASRRPRPGETRPGCGRVGRRGNSAFLCQADA